MNSRLKTENVMETKEVFSVVYCLNFGCMNPFPFFFSPLFFCPRVRRIPSCIVLNTITTELPLKLKFC